MKLFQDTPFSSSDMARRSNHVFEPARVMNTSQVIKESIRLILAHSSHFHSISIFFFSPVSLSLFFSHFLIHHFPSTPSFTVINHLFGANGAQALIKLLSKTILHITICFPCSITFSLLGKAATIQAVGDCYSDTSLNRGRLFSRSRLAWLKLLHTYICEFLILLIISGIFSISLTIVSKICSSVLGFWVVLGLLGVPFCVGFAHIMVTGSMAKVLTVLESDCYGFESLVKAKCLIEGRKKIALGIALFSNLGLILVEVLFEFRLCKRMSVWEAPMLVSMYSLVLVLDNVMNVVLYYTCRP